MKLPDFIPYLLDPISLNDLLLSEEINIDSEAILIYMEKEKDLESEIRLFEIEETSDNLTFEKNGVKYSQLFPINLTIRLIKSDLDLKSNSLSNFEIAKSLVDYGINDA